MILKGLKLSKDVTHYTEMQLNNRMQVLLLPYFLFNLREKNPLKLGTHKKELIGHLAGGKKDSFLSGTFYRILPMPINYRCKARIGLTWIIYYLVIHLFIYTCILGTSPTNVLHVSDAFTVICHMSHWCCYIMWACRWEVPIDMVPRCAHRRAGQSSGLRSGSEIWTSWMFGPVWIKRKKTRSPAQPE